MEINRSMPDSKTPEIDKLEPKPLVKTPFCEIWSSAEGDMAHLVIGDLSLRLDWSHMAGISSSINFALHRKGTNKRNCGHKVPHSKVLN